MTKEKNKHTNKDRIAALEHRIKALEDDRKAMLDKLKHMDDLLFAVMAEVRENVIEPQVRQAE